MRLAGDPGGGGAKRDMRGLAVPDGGGIDIAGGFTGLAEREDAALERKDAARARPVLGVRW